jgi:hypothetical protein
MTSLNCLLLTLMLLGPAGGGIEEDTKVLLIDDFSRTDGRSALGTEWQTFTDQVMGGVSRGSAVRDTVAQRPCLRLRGEVSLQNNGGFVQVALSARRENRPLDASAFSGIRLLATGNGETYYIHLRTSDTRLPWQYYQAAFQTDGQWRQIDIPFTAFRPENLRAALDPSRIERIGFVAAKKAFTADVAVARLAYYR